MTLYLPIAQMSVDALVLLLLGGITGTLSGLFGIGGGFLMTPLLIFIGVPPPIAVASVANQIIASSLSGFYTHWRKDNVDFRMGGLLLIGGVVGSSMGVWLFSRLQGMGQIDLVISIGYVLFLSIIGGSMAVESLGSIRRSLQRQRASIKAAGDIPTSLESAPPEPESRALGFTATASASPLGLGTTARRPWHQRLPLMMHFPRSQLKMSILIPLLLSAVIGVLVSLLGIGGGFFMIPAMLYILKMPASVVVGTSLFQVIFVTANVTFLHAVSTHSVDVVLAGLMLIGSSLGAQLGSRIGISVQPEYLRALLAGVVLIVAGRLGMGVMLRPDNLYSVSLSGVSG